MAQWSICLLVQRRETHLIAVSVLDQWATNNETVEAVEIHKLPSIAVTVFKTVLFYQRSMQGVVRAHDIQITRHDNNVTFTKPSLNGVLLVAENMLLHYIRGLHW